MILITGATGQLGSAVVQQLLGQSGPGQFAVFARDAAKAAHYQAQGIPVRIGDFDDPWDLPAAFAGVSKLLLISSRAMNRTEQQRAVVKAAAQAGVQHIVYTGLAVQDIRLSHVRDLMQSHFDTEAQIMASGMDYTFLRNTMYADALPEIIGPAWREHGISLPGGKGKVPYALRREMGEATANLLLQSGHAGKTYNLTGSSGHSYLDVAQALSQLSGQPIPYHDANPDAFTQRLEGIGLPEFLVHLTVDTVLDIRDHQYEVHSDALRQLLGREPAGLQAMVQEVFGPKPGGQ